MSSRAAVQMGGFGLLLGLFAHVASATELSLTAPGFPEAGVEELRASSLVLSTASEPDQTAQDKLAAARADYARLTRALYTQGRYGGVVSIKVNGREAAGISPLAGPARIDSIAITIDAGPAFTFADMQVTPLAPGTEMPEGFQEGALARSTVLSEATTAAINGWRDIGHAKAEISAQTIAANHPARTIKADIRIAPGPRLRFGALDLASSGAVREARLRQIAGLPTGDIFSPEELEKAAKRLRRTGAFRSVALREAETPGPQDTLDIIATLDDAKPRRVGFGAELSSLEGLTLSGFWMHRNLLGGAERLRIEAETSGIGGDSGGIDYRLSGRFERPATITADTSLFLEASIEELDEPDYRERNVRLGGGFSHIFSETLTGEIGLAYQYTEIDDDLGSRTVEHLLLPARLTFDDRDASLNAKSGIYLDAQLTPFLQLDEDGAGARLYFDMRGYQAFGADDDTVIALRAQLGSIAGASASDVPADMLFYSGGAGTVRGQGYQSLGVDLPGGGTIGGRSFAALSAEVRQDLWGAWSVVGFADAGFVGEDSFGENSGDWHAGGGFGVRYDTGFGPIRVDIATPLDSDAGQDFELYIGIGQAF